jgi:hypothetical protein
VIESSELPMNQAERRPILNLQIATACIAGTIKTAPCIISSSFKSQRLHRIDLCCATSRDIACQQGHDAK